MANKYLLAIDPGNIESAYTLIDEETYAPVQFEKLPNAQMRTYLKVQLSLCNRAEVVIEQVQHYGTGLAAGESTFDTCFEAGRFAQITEDVTGKEAERVRRPTVKTAICGTPRAKDSNVIQALKDRFGEKGTKKNPGWFYGFKADCWQAYALGVAWLDMRKEDLK